MGLFSGPAYTIYKALTAAKLAGSLTERGIPAVPIFWLATEDHDLAEVNHCWIFDAAHQPVRLELTCPDSHRPVGRIPIAEPPLALFRNSLAGFTFQDEVAALVERAYRPGETFGSAFLNLLQPLLAPYGLLFLDPLQPQARELAAPLLRQALAAAPELTARVLARNRELEEAGYHTQVHFEPQSSFVFLLDGDHRLTLHRNGDGYNAGEGVIATAELAERAAHLSPNALLRPVVQDYLLPTVAYVGGPAELAYLAQAQVLYEELLGRMPVAVHRGGFTLLDERAGRLMKRYGLALADFFHGEDVLRERISASLVPPELASRLKRTQMQFADWLEGLRVDVNTFDVTLAEALAKSRSKILYQLSKMERKVARETLRRNERAADHASYLYDLVFPLKHLQERFYSLLPFLAKHGPGLIDTLFDHVRLDCPDHQVLVPYLAVQTST